MLLDMSPPTARRTLISADTLMSALVENLLCPSSTMKEATLRLLGQLTQLSDNASNSTQEALTLALQIHEADHTLQKSRQTSMHIRRLPWLQKQVGKDPTTRKIIPYFCFGLFSTFPGQLAQDVCAALAEMCSIREDEDVIAEVAIRWLNGRSLQEAGASIPPTSEKPISKITPFQCSNVLQVKSLANSTFEVYRMPQERLIDMFKQSHEFDIRSMPPTARSHALQVFKALPALAEKHSRLTMPVLLSALSSQEGARQPVTGDEPPVSDVLQPETPEADWSYADQRAFLEILASFGNPRVLFKSAEIYDSLLGALTTGNLDFQRLALMAVFTWKHAYVRPYEANLLRLLDPKTFRDELSNFLIADEGGLTIQVGHRSGLMPILLRLLYGQMLVRSGSQGGPEVRRKAICRSMSQLSHDEILQFIDVALGPLVKLRGSEPETILESFVDRDLLTINQQHGLLNVMQTMLGTMQSQLSTFGEHLVSTVIYCTIRASRAVEESSGIGQLGIPQKGGLSARKVRKLGITCLDMLCRSCTELKWSTYMPLIFREIIQPRLPRFALEMAQDVSGLLRLFATWSSSAVLSHHLHDWDASLLEAVWQCLSTVSVKDDVKIFVLDKIVGSLTRCAIDDLSACAARAVLQAHTQSLLTHLGALLDLKPSRKVLESLVGILPSLASVVQSSEETRCVLSSLAVVLHEPSERLPPVIKGKLLRALHDLLVIHKADVGTQLSRQIQENVAPLFNYFRDSPTRLVLVSILCVLRDQDVELADIAQICDSLNAVASASLGEVDYESRLKGYTAINSLEMTNLPAFYLLPVIYNLLFFLRSDDLTIRSHSTACLKHLIINAASDGRTELQSVFKSVLLPAFKVGVKENSEIIRADHVALIGVLAQHFGADKGLDDMQGLLVGNDDEASFFNNILHVQQHRRMRAIRRMVGEAESGILKATNICTFFLPLLEKFILDLSADEAAHNLRGQAILATGVLLEQVEWNQFKAIFRRYRSYMDSKATSEKNVIKLLAGAADALTRAYGQASADTTIDLTADAVARRTSRLATTLPRPDKIATELGTNIVPSLMTFIHHKDESEISLRIPTAVTTVKLLKLLPAEHRSSWLPSVLLDVSHILRSRAQDSRDLARRTLSEITIILGPSCIEYLLKELRYSLARGYQLHVLSYTLHSILVAISPHLSAGDLDYCLPSLVSVVMDDIFGSVGSEKNNEEYVSQMKEVKRNKSFDSIELLARSATVRHMSQLVRPLQTLLSGGITSQESRQIDELLRRIGVGLLQNSASASRDVLVFAYEVIQDFYHQTPDKVIKGFTNQEANRQRLLVQLQSPNKMTSGSTSSSAYKLVRFALDLTRATLQKHRHLLQPENVHGFLPFLGDALIEAEDEVRMSALRFLSAIMKLPIPELDDNAVLYVSRAVTVIRGTINTNDEIAQAALKLVSAILRERRGVVPKDSDVSYLLRRITPDLGEPDRQGLAFNFVKAVLARRYMLPEVYECVDRIGSMMITDHTRGARDAARSVYVQFLLEYPQSKNRWSKQLKFLVKNLEYDHSEGRQSVMEAIHVLMTKTGGDILQEFVGTFFMPTALILGGDDNEECRAMAGALVAQIFRVASAGQLRSLMVPLRSWIGQIQNPALTTLGMQAYKIMIEMPGASLPKDVPSLISGVYLLLQTDEIVEAENSMVIYHALQLFAAIVEVYPSIGPTKETDSLWSAVPAYLSHPHPWVQSCAATLIGGQFSSWVKQHAKLGLSVVPLVNKGGMRLDAKDLLDIMRSSFRQLQRNQSNQELSTQTVRNLVFLGRCFDVNKVTIPICDTPSTEDPQESQSDSPDEPKASRNILAIQYLFDRASAIVRHEPPKSTTGSLLPKQSIVHLLSVLIPHISLAHLQSYVPTILVPLHHLTDPNTPTPNTNDAEFQSAYHRLVTDAQLLLEITQKRLGDAAYVQAMTEVAKIVRDRREGRRTKRRLEAVNAPERFAQEKRRRNEKKKVRKKQVGSEHRGRRRGW